MSNNVNTNPMIIDTFNADFQINGPITIKKVVLFSAANSDVFSLLHGQNSGAPEGIRIKQTSDLVSMEDFNGAEHCFPNGLYFSSGAINAGLDNGTDRVLIYLK